jgi:hypothetical protein
VAQLLSCCGSQSRDMVEDAAARVDFATAEALAFGTLMLHHRVGAREAGDMPADPDEAAALGLNLGHYGENCFLLVASYVS